MREPEERQLSLSMGRDKQGQLEPQCSRFSELTDAKGSRAEEASQSVKTEAKQAKTKARRPPGCPQPLPAECGLLDRGSPHSPGAGAGEPAVV